MEGTRPCSQGLRLTFFFTAKVCAKDMALFTCCAVGSQIFFSMTARHEPHTTVFQSWLVESYPACSCSFILHSWRPISCILMPRSRSICVWIFIDQHIKVKRHFWLTEYDFSNLICSLMNRSLAHVLNKIRWPHDLTHIFYPFSHFFDMIPQVMPVSKSINFTSVHKIMCCDVNRNELFWT
jgi:hypothetical protein